MLNKFAIVVSLFLFVNKGWSGINIKGYSLIIENDTISISAVSNSGLQLEEDKLRPNPLLQFFRAKQKKNKKITAAILAFPFPFGMVGLHRIYLGCSPYTPIVYIATVGGAFGILPFIDFCVLILEKDIDRFINNDKVFMWVK